MTSESAVKYLRQSNGGQRVDTRCCNFRCQQGRTCKVHQACEVPEPPQPTGPDLRAILMHQLPAPAALSREQQALVDRRAWALAHEAYELLREHIQRTVAWRTTEALRATHPHLVERAINGVTLQNALAHPQAEAVAQARDMMRVMVTALANSAAEVEREWAQSGAKQATGVPA